MINTAAIPVYKIFTAALLISCFFLFSCENSQKEIDNLYKKKIGIEEAKDIELIYTMGGKTKSILRSPLMLHVQDTIIYYEFPKTLSSDFYNETGVIESKLTAKYGRYTETKSVVFLKDSVKVINIQKGDTLYCDELYWDRNRVGTEFYTDKPVKIRTRTQTLNGTGLEASQDFKRKRILYPVGTVAVPANQFPQ